ncbi:hypothetical protein EDC04DRAFT_1022399 [Pisolithus marmoratus]|nr:hypothetical protein EDC04DRAFT_1022399 [Pisolithus marmoratus]
MQLKECSLQLFCRTHCVDAATKCEVPGQATYSRNGLPATDTNHKIGRILSETRCGTRNGCHSRPVIKTFPPVRCSSSSALRSCLSEQLTGDSLLIVTRLDGTSQSLDNVRVSLNQLLILRHVAQRALLMLHYGGDEKTPHECSGYIFHGPPILEKPDNDNGQYKASPHWIYSISLQESFPASCVWHLRQVGFAGWSVGFAMMTYNCAYVTHRSGLPNDHANRQVTW